MRKMNKYVYVLHTCMYMCTHMCMFVFIHVHIHPYPLCFCTASSTQGVPLKRATREPDIPDSLPRPWKATPVINDRSSRLSEASDGDAACRQIQVWAGAGSSSRPTCSLWKQSLVGSGKHRFSKNKSSCGSAWDFVCAMCLYMCVCVCVCLSHIPCMSPSDTLRGVSIGLYRSLRKASGLCLPG